MVESKRLSVTSEATMARACIPPPTLASSPSLRRARGHRKAPATTVPSSSSSPSKVFDPLSGTLVPSTACVLMNERETLPADPTAPFLSTSVMFAKTVVPADMTTLPSTLMSVATEKNTSCPTATSSDDRVSERMTGMKVFGFSITVLIFSGPASHSWGLLVQKAGGLLMFIVTPSAFALRPSKDSKKTKTCTLLKHQFFSETQQRGRC